MSANIGLGPNSTLSVPDHVLTRTAAGETVLLNLDNEQYYGLDGVGTSLWRLVESGTTFGQAVAALLDEYAVDQETLQADLKVVLEDLISNGLVLIDA